MKNFTHTLTQQGLQMSSSPKYIMNTLDKTFVNSPYFVGYVVQVHTFFSNDDDGRPPTHRGWVPESNSRSFRQKTQRLWIPRLTYLRTLPGPLVLTSPEETIFCHGSNDVEPTLELWVHYIHLGTFPCSGSRPADEVCLGS